MVNYVSNDITVVGNEKVQERMDQYIEALEKLEKYSDNGGFATMKSYEEISEFQYDYISMWYEIINEGGGETIDYKETEEETV